MTLTTSQTIRKTGTILVIDDEEGVRSVTTSLLIGRGYTVLEASNGHDALNICSDVQRSIDLAIVDIVMPGLDGFEFVDRAKKIRKDFRVIFMSGYAGRPHILKWSKVLADSQGFISKPFSLALLVQTVEKALGDQS
jgi:CheY-like chemotaxis protein